jgi:hypothetical protein
MPGPGGPPIIPPGPGGGPPGKPGMPGPPGPVVPVVFSAPLFRMTRTIRYSALATGATIKHAAVAHIQCLIHFIGFPFRSRSGREGCILSR